MQSLVLNLAVKNTTIMKCISAQKIHLFTTVKSFLKEELRFTFHDHKQDLSMVLLNLQFHFLYFQSPRKQ